MLDITEIKRIIPHRYPMLLIDRVEELIPGEKAVARRNVTINEELFNIACFLYINILHATRNDRIHL